METKTFCCILHERLTSEEVNPFYYPIHTFVVAFNGQVNRNTVFCEDEGSALGIEWLDNRIRINLGFKKGNKDIAEWEWIYGEWDDYVIDTVKHIRIPICDASEAWIVYISNRIVEEERIKAIMPGYEKGHDGVYSCIKDNSESKKRAFGNCLPFAY